MYSGKITVSIIICTRNRAEHLRQTLVAMGKVCVPKSLAVELIVVDNASKDHTAEVVKQCTLPDIPICYVYEAQSGLSRARNAGMSAARGDIILFTDDDVRPPHNWIEGMCTPILLEEADAVAGGVKLAPHLERSWMKPLHRGWLANTEEINPNNPDRMVGANMAISKVVLEKVPQFDEELGAGSIFLAEDTLFSQQLKRTGYRIKGALEVVVEHHFDVSRLLRSNFLKVAQNSGRTTAYYFHHWLHMEVAAPALRFYKHEAQLTMMRMLKRCECNTIEGMPLWEMKLVEEVSFYKQYLLERRRPRNYAKYGLIKR